jgi:putative phage-type endonuclease
MEIIKNIEQGSEEWFKMRLGVATASNFSKIVTSTGKLSTTLSAYALDLASQSLLEEQEESYQNEAMRRGNELEPEAKQAYQEATFNSVEEVTFITCGDYGYSPDGLVSEDGLIEIKCPQANTHTKYLCDNKLPTAYIQQVQGGLMVSGRKWCDFVSYHPSFKGDKKLFIVRVERDEEFIKALKAGIDLVIKKRNEILEKLK